jgi:hypothetical protein
MRLHAIVYEKFLWATTYDWGNLAFGIREKERCLTGPAPPGREHLA